MTKTDQANGWTAARHRSERIYEEMRHRICTNRYPPETVLHEEELAKDFSVSRTPIRRVLSMLEHDKLVMARHGVGNIVTKVEPDQLLDVYSVRMMLAQAAGDFYRPPFPPEAFEVLTRSRKEFRALKKGDVTGFG